MRRLILIAAIFVLAAASAVPQSSKDADPKDVDSLDNIMRAVYDVISGDKGTPRNWDRMRSLFYKDARLIPSNKNAQTGVVGARVLSPDEYIKRAEPFFNEQGFYERESARHVDIYGNIAQVFSTYESRHSPGDSKPFQRGINSFQLLNDGKRWWILTIYWQPETPETPIPKKYLKSRD